MRGKPLAGKNVVVTRPAHQAQAFARLIKDAGGRAILFPAIEIRDVKDPWSVTRLVDRLDQYDLAIFVSPNAVERAMLLADGPHIAVEDLRLGDTGTFSSPRDAASIIKIPPTGIPLEDIERLAVVEALKMSNWVQKDAAELLAISPRVMNYKIKTLGIDFPRGRRAALQLHEPSAAVV